MIWEADAGPDAQAAVDRDHELLGAVHDGTRPGLLRLWVNRQALVVTRRDARTPRFETIARTFAAEGWPIAVRQTGGGAVTHGADSLNVSLIQSEPREMSFCPDRHYRALADCVTPALAGLGLTAALAPVAGAYCPGDHDLHVGGQKIAGLAQRVRTGKAADGVAKRTVLSHLTLLVSSDPAAMTARINAFYDGIGDPRSYSDTVSTSLSALSGQALTPAMIANRISAAQT